MPRGTVNNPVACISCTKPRAFRQGEPCQVCKMHAAHSNRRYRWTPEFDAAITHGYRGSKNRVELMATITRLVRHTGFPRHQILYRAQQLGLTANERRPWTAADIEQLRELAGSMLAWRIAEKTGRTYQSVITQLSRLHISSRLNSGYSVRDLTECMGVAQKTVVQWLARGWLRRVSRGVYSEGRIPETQVLRLLKEHPEEYRLNRVDEAWFKGMLFKAFGVGMETPKQPVRHDREEIQEARLA